ncbi:hypothetical protein HHK36_012820 [Tetracentron sinense]|uniref:AP2/ERF domain-containing protein n=1 Tax=Tetracentron sinense TaxID=13715 RepID=A0A834ZDJ3_TETSI|nr:hypothetical protein HHK36_012820 [Tetracentron sinense]
MKEAGRGKVKEEKGKGEARCRGIRKRSRSKIAAQIRNPITKEDATRAYDRAAHALRGKQIIELECFDHKLLEELLESEEERKARDTDNSLSFEVVVGLAEAGCGDVMLMVGSDGIRLEVDGEFGCDGLVTLAGRKLEEEKA